MNTTTGASNASTALRITTWRRLLHWSTAAFVILLIAVGKSMSDLELDSLSVIEANLWKFSLHKTVGLVVFLVTLCRVISMWFGSGFTHSAHSRTEVIAASAVQAYFIGALIALPLTGLMMHAFASGTAPIYGLPKTWLHAANESADLVTIGASLHHLIGNGLLAALLLHVGGVLKHQFVDRDTTLRRMWSGRTKTQTISTGEYESVERSARLGQWLGALALLAVVGVGVRLGLVEVNSVDNSSGSTAVLDKPGAETSSAAASGAGSSDWESVDTESRLSIEAVQGKDPFRAEFERFKVYLTEDAEGAPIAIRVVIDSASFSSGVKDRDQVVAGSDWLDAKTHPESRYRAETIHAEGDDNYVADGELQIGERQAPVAIRFKLTPDATANRQIMVGTSEFDRFSIELGRGEFAAEGAAGKMIVVNFELTLEREQ